MVSPRPVVRRRSRATHEVDGTSLPGFGIGSEGAGGREGGEHAAEEGEEPHGGFPKCGGVGENTQEERDGSRVELGSWIRWAVAMFGQPYMYLDRQSSAAQAHSAPGVDGHPAVRRGFLQ